MVKPATIWIVLSLVVSCGWSIRQLDVHNAFLHGELNEEVYMRQPSGFEHFKIFNHDLQLHKALYGLKQSPRVWFSKFSSCLLNWGFEASKADTSMFVYKVGSHIVVFLFNVDDFLVTGNSLFLIQRYISDLHLQFSLKDKSNLTYFLGVQVVRNKNGMLLSQQK